MNITHALKAFQTSGRIAVEVEDGLRFRLRLLNDGSGSLFEKITATVDTNGQIDYGSRTVTAGGRSVALTQNEFDLSRCLFRCAVRVQDPDGARKAKITSSAADFSKYASGDTMVIERGMEKIHVTVSVENAKLIDKLRKGHGFRERIAVPEAPRDMAEVLSAPRAPNDYGVVPENIAGLVTQGRRIDLNTIMIRLQKTGKFKAKIGDNSVFAIEYVKSQEPGEIEKFEQLQSKGMTAIPASLVKLSNGDATVLFLDELTVIRTAMWSSAVARNFEGAKQAKLTRAKHLPKDYVPSEKNALRIYARDRHVDLAMTVTNLVKLDQKNILANIRSEMPI